MANSNTSGNDVYPVLANHQRQEEWDGQQAAANLQTWTERFEGEFKLGLPPIVLRLDELPVSQLGLFRFGHNGFGIRGEVALNRRYLNATRPRWEPLATLLHQLLHA